MEANLEQIHYKNQKCYGQRTTQSRFEIRAFFFVNKVLPVQCESCVTKNAISICQLFRCHADGNLLEALWLQRKKREFQTVIVLSGILSTFSF